MEREVKERMEAIGYSEVKEYDDFLFGVNKHGLLIKITAVKGNKVVNVNLLEYEEGHSYSYYVDMVNNQKECLLEKYFKLKKTDLDIKRRLKLN